MNLFYVIAASIFLFARSSEGFTVLSGQPSKPSSPQLYDKTPGSKLDDAIDNAKAETSNARDKVSESAEEAGSQIGGAIDLGVQQAKDAFDIEK